MENSVLSKKTKKSRMLWFAPSGADPQEAGFMVAEPRPAGEWGPPDERSLQCVWHDARLRPAGLHTTEGLSVEIEHPGVWNLQAGPDFLRAVLRIGPDRRRVTGDVEVHLRPGDWIQHRHSGDARYAGVCAHVTWAGGTLEPGILPAGTVEISLREPLAAQHAFSFDDLDTAAYPWAAPASPAPCAIELASWDADAREALLAAAGEDRMRAKAARFAAIALRRGENQALYEELLGGLGYTANSAAFRWLAQRLPLAALYEKSEGDSGRAYALLLGMSGLLPPAEDASWGDATRQYWRSLWKIWWKASADFPSPLQYSQWKLSPMRPLNHPVRRMAAAAEWFSREPRPAAKLRALAAGKEPAKALAGWFAWLDCVPYGYWRGRPAWNAEVGSRAEALVGRGRSLALVINTVLPFMSASGLPDEVWRAMLEILPPEDISGCAREAVHALFGREHSPSLYRSGLRRQGLLHLLHEYCLRRKYPCEECPLPRRLKAHGGEIE